jgi:hypothetical protein
MTTRPVPMSGEVLAQHLEQHACDAGMDVLRCPCDDTAIFVCEACGEVLFAASREGRWCEHAAAMWEAFR